MRLDAPVPDQLEVSVVCTGNFKDGDDQIAQVAVRLRYEDPDNQYTQEGQVVFTQENQNLPWKIDLRNAQKRDYHYNYTIVYKDGVVRNVPETGGWLPGEPGFITVGEKYSLEVDLYPDAADLSRSRQAGADRSRRTRIHRTTSTTPGASCSRRRPARRGRGGYAARPVDPSASRYVVKYFASNGAVESLAPTTSEADAVVIPPPAPLPPPPAPPAPPA